MKKTWTMVILLVLASLLLGACMGSALSFEDVQTQAAIFAQATLTRIALGTHAALTNTVSRSAADQYAGDARRQCSPSDTPVPPTAEPLPAPRPRSCLLKRASDRWDYVHHPIRYTRPVVYDPIRLSFAEGATRISAAKAARLIIPCAALFFWAVRTSTSKSR